MRVETVLLIASVIALAWVGLDLLSRGLPW